MTETETTVATEDVSPKRIRGTNPMLSRRMVNAHARLSGCTEHDPNEMCEHRVYSLRTMEKLLALYEAEQ